MSLRSLLPWVLLLVLLAAGAARLRFDVEVLNLLPAESRTVQGLRLYQENFSNARELILTVRAPMADMAEQTAKSLAESLRASPGLAADVAWRQPWLEDPLQAAELVGYLWINQPPEIFGALTNRLLGPAAERTVVSTRDQLATSMSPTEIARLSRDPFNLLRLPDSDSTPDLFTDGQNIFASPDGNFRLIFVRTDDDLASYQACRAWLNKVQACVESACAQGKVPSEVVIRCTGRPAFVTEIAGGMERDINGSIGGTLIIIVLLFLWAHRSWRPLLWLVTLLIAVLCGTIAFGGLLLGALNVVSAGFAAILLGLAGDYALVLYQEHRAAPTESPAQIRRKAGPSIVWSAISTAGAFLILNAGGLPGLAQLGSLVAIGICLAAVVMLYGFLPPLARAESKKKTPAIAPARDTRIQAVFAGGVAWTITVVVLLGAALLLWRRPPVLDHSPDPLRPRHSAAYGALDEIRAEMARDREPLWLIIQGRDESEVAQRLDQVTPVLAAARDQGAVSDFTLPAQLWPRPNFQAANRATAKRLLNASPHLRQTALTAGFTPESLAMTDAIIAAWKSALLSPAVFWPSNHLSEWVLGKFTAQVDGQCLALGLVYPAAAASPPALNAADSPARILNGRGGSNDTQRNSLAGYRLARSDEPYRSSDLSLAWTRALPREGVWVAGWELLGPAVLEVVQRDLWRVLIPMATLLCGVLWLAFRRASEVVLSLATLGVSAASLLAVMSLAGWSWNLMNLMAIPLLVGVGVDYSLHMQLALRRHGGDILVTRRIIGRALLLCAGTTVAGFGSLSWSSNAGLASLGTVCATGIALTFLTSVYLLPHWWRRFAGLTPLPSGDAANSSPREASAPGPAARTASADLDRPSALYRSGFWRAGHWAVTWLPGSAISSLSRVLPAIYWRLNSRRRETVIRNLLPAVENDQDRATALSRELFHQFAIKVADLWRYETGSAIESLISDLKGWKHFVAAQQHGRGILLLTPHLGNWELGAPLLARRGVNVTVITLDEPDPSLTALRQNSRSRWGIETVVIGQNLFAFVDVIRRLESGSTVALLIDRPPAASATEVQLFGRPFSASIAAAELARASGCVLLPVFMPRIGSGYGAEVLPEIAYDRSALGSRRARAELTQEITRVFEPVIKQYVSQWYHFVPLWPEK